MQNLNYLNYFYFFPPAAELHWEGGEQLKPKLSSSVLYQMAITLQLFFIHLLSKHPPPQTNLLKEAEERGGSAREL